jgi:MFS family permease
VVPADDASGAAARPWLALAAVCMGGIMVVLDGSAVTIAAPRIARSVHASLGDLELIANVYLVVLALGILPAGRLADRVGRRATFIAGALGFGASSLAISLSHSVGELVVFRAGQGLFGALLQPAALALLSTAFPRERLGAVSSFAVFGLLFLLTFYLQNVHGFKPSTAGAWLLTPTLAVVIGAPVGGVVAERIGPRRPVVLGMLAVAGGLVGLAQVPVDAAFWQVAAPAVLIGFGTGAWVIAATRTIVTESPEQLVGTASALQQAASQVGGVLGIAILGAVMSIRVGDDLARRLHEGGVPRSLAAVALRSRGLVVEGRAPVLRGAPPQVAHVVATVSHALFTDGMHSAFLLSAALIVLASPLGLLLGSVRPPSA